MFIQARTAITCMFNQAQTAITVRLLQTLAIFSMFL